IDFCMDRRDEVIDYVRGKYGDTSVGQIATFHQLKSRSVVRDVGRVMGMTPSDAGRIASMIPEPMQGKTVPIAKAMETEDRLKATYDEDPGVKELLDTAMQLENLNRHAGMHAAGVVMSEGPLWDHVPVFCPEPGVYVTQYDKDDVEAAGLVKFDFLGLKTLTVIDIAVKLIDKRPDRAGRPFDLDAIPMDDKATFALLQSGETTNVFQLESSGMQNLFRQLRPDCFDDIVAAVALYRPGPLGTGMVEDYINCKNGRQKPDYPHPCLEPILKDTWGVIVYQEQVMQIARTMGGYSLGGADLLRRAMGKKKESEMAKQRAVFVEGSVNNGHSAEEAGRIFDLVAHFAGYGFNKAHSAAYGLIAYQTAWLKTHYPVEFICATLTADKDKTEKVVRTVAEARSMGITVLPPDVNESEIDFTVVYEEEEKAFKRRPDRPVSLGGKLRDPWVPKIRFGLGGVKGIGSGALEAIFEARSQTPDGEAAEDAKQPFTDLFDLASRVDLKRVNKGVAEALVQCGAFDAVHGPLGVDRASAHSAIEAALERGRRASADRAAGQTSLFGLLEPAQARAAQRVGGSSFPKVEPWDLKELLAREKATLGFYVSGHPLERYSDELSRFCDASTATLSSRKDGSRVTIGGSVEGYRERPTKTGGKMAFFHLEDPQGRVEVIVRTKQLEASREILASGDPVLLTADLKFERDRNGSDESPAESKLVLLEVAMLADELRARTKSVRLRLKVERTNPNQLEALKRTLEEHPGPCPVTLELRSTERWMVRFAKTGLSVEPSEQFLSSLERLFGEKVCELR
ncbi:MAG: DNA polymerase III subunit alpha, partial [Myxococcales bacterium]|nr:DNA polymerase III subunit alpha [Myxococcales bacterium]